MLVQTAIFFSKRVALTARDINFLIQYRKNAVALEGRKRRVCQRRKIMKKKWNDCAAGTATIPVIPFVFRGKVSTLDGQGFLAQTVHGSFLNNKRKNQKIHGKRYIQIINQLLKEVQQRY